MPEKLLSAFEAANIAQAYRDRPVIIPESVIQAIRQSAAKGRFECDIANNIEDWARVSVKLKEAGYKTRHYPAGNNETSIEISWEGANDPQPGPENK